MSFEDLGTWEVSARQGGEEQLAGRLVQTTPEDAVALLMVSVRMTFEVEPEQWSGWAFFCSLRHGFSVRTVVVGVSALGRPVRLMDSLSGLSGSTDGRP